ncbi:hypothetical protein AOQ84DRAFT_378729 [Glonium stellatum]|uniref:Uncharacterized protein n=1 Tax=Glonium stellatum TaxID=574774 RepID=A0A8E2JQY2_9PEZI|nr:hypothetical protein AOQ84DRAFT_378729 [Glonium stellatum]
MLSCLLYLVAFVAFQPQLSNDHYSIQTSYPFDIIAYVESEVLLMITRAPTMTVARPTPTMKSFLSTMNGDILFLETTSLASALFTYSHSELNQIQGTKDAISKMTRFLLTNTAPVYHESMLSSPVFPMEAQPEFGFRIIMLGLASFVFVERQQIYTFFMAKLPRWCTLLWGKIPPQQVLLAATRKMRNSVSPSASCLLFLALFPIMLRNNIAQLQANIRIHILRFKMAQDLFLWAIFTGLPILCALCIPHIKTALIWVIHRGFSLLRVTSLTLCNSIRRLWFIWENRRVTLWAEISELKATIHTLVEENKFLAQQNDDILNANQDLQAEVDKLLQNVKSMKTEEEFNDIVLKCWALEDASDQRYFDGIVEGKKKRAEEVTTWQNMFDSEFNKRAGLEEELGMLLRSLNLQLEQAVKDLKRNKDAQSDASHLCVDLMASSSTLSATSTSSRDSAPGLLGHGIQPHQDLLNIQQRAQANARIRQAQAKAQAQAQVETIKAQLLRQATIQMQQSRLEPPRGVSASAVHSPFNYDHNQAHSSLPVLVQAPQQLQTVKPDSLFPDRSSSNAGYVTDAPNRTTNGRALDNVSSGDPDRIQEGINLSHGSPGPTVRAPTGEGSSSASNGNSRRHNIFSLPSIITARGGVSHSIRGTPAGAQTGTSVSHGSLGSRTGGSTGGDATNASTSSAPKWFSFNIDSSNGTSNSNPTDDSLASKLKGLSTM